MRPGFGLKEVRARASRATIAIAAQAMRCCRLATANAFGHDAGAAAIWTFAAALQIAGPFADVTYIFTCARGAGRCIVAGIELIVWRSTHEKSPC
jgi:hypothetical protein